MKNLMKRVTSILLLGIFVLSSMPIIQVSASAKYTTALMSNILYKIGCVDNENGIDEEISIREFMQNAHRLQGFNDEVITESNDKIALMQAVRVLVDSLGYKIKVKDDYDYMLIAKQIGLLEGISSGQNDIIKKGTAHALLFNALSIKHFERSAFGSKEDYEEVDKTFLKNVFNIRKIDGVIESIQQNSSVISKDRVIVSTKEYGKVSLYYNKLDIYNSIGINATMFVKLQNTNIYDITESDLSGGSILGYARNHSDVVTVKKGDIVSYDPLNDKLNYKDSADNKYVISTLDNITVVYNGKVTTTNTTLNGSVAGSTNFVDNNNDGIYDYAVIWDYYDLFVDAAYPESKTYRSKYSLYGRLLEISTGKNFKFDADKFNYIIEKDGVRQEPKVIKKGDVLNLAVSEDKKFVKVIVTSTKVEGAVSEMSLVTKSATELNLTDSYIIIAEKKYKLSKDYYTAVKVNNIELPYKLMDTGKFYTNFEGKIAYSDMAVPADKYGYLLDASTSGGINDTVKIKLLDKESIWQIYELNSKITINSNSVKASKIASEGYTTLFLKNGTALTATPQLVQYTLTEDNKINTLRIAKTGYDFYNFSMDNDYTVNTRKYLSKGDQIGDAYLTTDTLVFNIDGPVTDEDSYSVANKDLFVDKDYSYSAKIYDRDKDSNTAVIVNFGPKAVVNQKTKLAVIKNISQGINAAGDTRTKVSFYQDKEEKSLFLSNEVEIKRIVTSPDSKVIELFPAKTAIPSTLPISDLVTGTVFQYSMKNSEEIGSILITANLNDSLSDFTIGDMETSDKFMAIYGSATDVRTVTIGVRNIMYKVDENVNVYLYDKATKKTFTIDLSSIEKDSKVLIKLTDCKVTDIIKIK